MTEAKRIPGLIVVAPGETRLEKPNRVWKVLTESQRADDKEGWIHNCGTDIMGVAVFLSVRDGLFPLSGTGETVNEVVPYCPKCEYAPEGHGTINLKGVIDVQALLKN
ncbi:MAG: hypothetical protein HY602_03475 [Parcubacteria group bacterium]|nr:hypothetical protein [Parcubacteria group bacterium]